MVKSNPGYLGISEPISLSGPTEKDVIQTAEVEKFLADAGLYESQEEAVSREEVLGKLDRTVKTWIKKATRVSGYGDQFVQQANAKIFTFGSYRLGVHGLGADIDTLYVGPRHATRNILEIMWLVCSSFFAFIFSTSILSSQAIDENRATWDDLFEPYPFFELYRNYLEVGITARNEDDLTNWKGWVESHLRTLVLKVAVLAYVHRREGIDIDVSHVKRKDIPLFVFSGGVRPRRSSRTAARNSRTVSRNDVTADVQVGNPLGVSRNDVTVDGQVGNPLTAESWSDPQSVVDRSRGYQSTSLLAPSVSSKETQNILNGHSNLHTEFVEHKHPGHFLGGTSSPGNIVVSDVVTQPINMPSTSSNAGPTNGLAICFNSSHKESEGIPSNNPVNFYPAVADELVSYQAKPDNKHVVPLHGSSLEGCSRRSPGQTRNLSSHGNNHLKRKAEEELELLPLFPSYDF
uniref:Poly(A) polymerase n=1 Tax=Aegilops tauschii TaxID=37682 RepID=R7W411_AEGTA